MKNNHLKMGIILDILLSILLVCFQKNTSFFLFYVIQFQNLEIFGNCAAVGEALHSAFALQKYCL